MPKRLAFWTRPIQFTPSIVLYRSRFPKNLVGGPSSISSFPSTDVENKKKNVQIKRKTTNGNGRKGHQETADLPIGYSPVVNSYIKVRSRRKKIKLILIKRYISLPISSAKWDGDGRRASMTPRRRSQSFWNIEQDNDERVKAKCVQRGGDDTTRAFGSGGGVGRCWKGIASKNTSAVTRVQTAGNRKCTACCVSCVQWVAPQSRKEEMNVSIFMLRQRGGIVQDSSSSSRCISQLQ